jgi:hypothetical protein
VLAALLCPVVENLPAGQADLAPLLPGRAELGTWEPAAEPQVFKGEDLFVYIDGGADIYLEYGFIQVLVQDYRNAAGHGMSLEIFQMTSEESAFGIYTFKTAPGGKEIALGDGCRLVDYYLNLMKGNLVVTITGLDQDTVREEKLLFLARAVERRIKGAASRPILAGLLPPEGLKPQSLKFFKGPLGLANADRFFAGSALGFERGIKGDYIPGYSLVLLEFRNGQVADEHFIRSLDFFSRTRKLGDFKGRGGGFDGTDETGKTICGELHGRFIILVAGTAGREQAGKVIARLAENLPSGP